MEDKVISHKLGGGFGAQLHDTDRTIAEDSVDSSTRKVWKATERFRTAAANSLQQKLHWAWSGSGSGAARPGTQTAPRLGLGETDNQKIQELRQEAPVLVTEASDPWGTGTCGDGKSLYPGSTWWCRAEQLGRTPAASSRWLSTTWAVSTCQSPDPTRGNL